MRIPRPPPGGHPDSAARPVQSATTHVRSAVGVTFRPDCRRASAALVSAAGHGLLMRPQIKAYRVCEVPMETFEQFQRLSDDRQGKAHDISIVSEQLAGITADLVAALVGHGQAVAATPLIVAVDDPGLWTEDADGSSYVSVLDSAWLAERTGLSVLDALPARDLVQRGCGGPLAAMGQWLLLGSHEAPFARVLVELEDTVRLTSLPPISADHAACSLLVAFDIGPGMNLLDRLTESLTGGRESSDVHGTLAVQGRQIPDLLRQWLNHPIFAERKWHRRGIPEDCLLDSIRQGAGDHAWPWQDLLCTATHLVAASIARAVQQHLPRAVPYKELILTGKGRQNGFLLREVRHHLEGMTVATIDAVGVEDDALHPAATALLGLMYIDRIPTGLTTLTGAVIPRVLGRLTPGSPANWHRLVGEMARPDPPKMTLRSAI